MISHPEAAAVLIIQALELAKIDLLPAGFTCEEKNRIQYPHEIG